MQIRICRVGTSETVEFALDELRRYLYKIDETVDVEVFCYDSYNPSRKDVIWLMADPAFAPEVPDPSMDDAFRIKINKNAGVIAGTNPISVLIGVYSLLKKLGVELVGSEVEFADFKDVADYAKEAVSALVGAGIVNGKSSKIAPTDYTTRAEVAVLIKRILDYKA